MHEKDQRKIESSFLLFKTTLNLALGEITISCLNESSFPFLTKSSKLTYVESFLVVNLRSLIAGLLNFFVCKLNVKSHDFPVHQEEEKKVPFDQIREEGEEERGS